MRAEVEEGRFYALLWTLKSGSVKMVVIKCVVVIDYCYYSDGCNH